MSAGNFCFLFCDQSVSESGFILPACRVLMFINVNANMSCILNIVSLCCQAVLADRPDIQSGLRSDNFLYMHGFVMQRSLSSQCIYITYLSWFYVWMFSVLEIFRNGKKMNSMKLVIPLHSLYWSIHTKDESKRGTAFAFIFGVN